MRFLHVSDLHFGKRLLEKDLLEDTCFASKQILQLAAEQQVDALLIAGDVYDKTDPSAEAVAAAGRFLTELSALPCPTFIISGNHDSAVRLAYCNGILKQHNVHIITAASAPLAEITLTDAYGPLNLYLLPFVKPAMARNLLGDAFAFSNEDKQRPIQTTDDAVAALLQATAPDATQRNLLLAHQFVAGGSTSDSEELFTGGTAAVLPARFAAFDYVALGHLHRAQQIGRATIRYSGSPVCYSFSEVRQQKCALLVECREKNAVTVTELPLRPLHNMQTVKGSLQGLLRTPASTDYLSITLTDEEPPLNAAALLLTHFPNMLRFTVENAKNASVFSGAAPQEDLESMSVEELFVDFYKRQNSGIAPNAEQTRLLQALLHEEVSRK